MNYYIKTSSLLCSSLLISQLQAATLGQVTVTDPVQGARSITYEQVNDFAVVEGDILLGKIDDFHQGAVIMPRLGGYRWTNGIIPYQVDENLPFMNKLAIYQAIDHWQKKTSLEFIELNSKNRLEHKDYIAFIPAQGTTCSSYVGRQGGMQEINLSPRCTTMNTVHEIGHALGLWHEQSRADRNHYVRILWENISEDHKYNFDQQLTQSKDYGDYDYDSIMHYGPYAFSKNGEKTIIPLIDGVEIGQRNHLSDKDILAIKAMYPDV